MLQGACSIVVASRSPELRPSIGQALGCRVSDDLSTVTVFVVEPHCRALLADLTTSGAIAVVFTNSASTRSLQLKGKDAALVPLESADGERITTHTGSLVREWSATGQPEAFTRALLGREPGEALAAIRFTPYVAFDQTPGAGAGLPLLGGT